MTLDPGVFARGAPFLLACLPPLAPVVFFWRGKAALGAEQAHASAVAAQIETLKGELRSASETRRIHHEQEQASAELRTLQLQTGGGSEPLPVPRSALQQEQDIELAWFKAFDTELDGWLTAAGDFDLGALQEQMDALSQFARRIQAARSVEEIAVVKAKTKEPVIDLLKGTISKTDRDLDPGRENDTLQRALTSVVQAAGLSMTGAKGEEVDSARHMVAGTLAPTGNNRRGTVAAVRTRGLMDGKNRVYAMAEILEYD